MSTFFSPIEQRFIRDHLTDDVRALLLRSYPDGTDIKRLAVQIAARQKAKGKLPAWYAMDELVFPPALSVEQASSEQTARYKASLVQGDLLIDLTGGLGVDTWAFAGRVNQVVYVERRAELAELAAYNLPLLGATNVTFQVDNGIKFIEKAEMDKPGHVADWLYLDPHRRDEQGDKVVRLQDCEPDLSSVNTVSALLRTTNHILIKTSPLLDIDATVRQLAGTVETVHVVAVQGEVKEILFVLGNQIVAYEHVQMQATNLLPNQTVSLGFKRDDERTANATFGDPRRYLYEPNAAVLKAGAFRLIADRFGLTKLAPNSHLYTSDTLRSDFPGRVFALQSVIKPDAKVLKKVLPAQKANLTVRNYPQSVAELRKKLNLREGGEVYILATTLLNGDKRLLLTEKVALPT